jgi:hypothetical protein
MKRNSDQDNCIVVRNPINFGSSDDGPALRSDCHRSRPVGRHLSLLGPERPLNAVSSAYIPPPDTWVSGFCISAQHPSATFESRLRIAREVSNQYQRRGAPAPKSKKPSISVPNEDASIRCEPARACAVIPACPMDSRASCGIMRLQRR